VYTAPDGSDDSSLLSAQPPIHAGDQYTTRGWVSTPTVPLLRASTKNYPDWIKARYLQVPDKLSAKFSLLARQITFSLSNPYDQTDAITQYLRETITYSNQVPNPPVGRDPLDYFLFNTKEGYCNYFASAEVMLLRSLGIPARLSVGFAQGQVQEGTLGASNSAGQVYETYTVRYRDSHAWPEVYFNDLGWIEFEPTTSQPNRDILLAADTSGDNPNNLDPFLAEAARHGMSGLGDQPSSVPVTMPKNEANTTSQKVAGAILLGLILFGLALYYLSKRWTFKLPVVPAWVEGQFRKRGRKVPGWIHNWALRALSSPVERAYGAINMALHLLGKPVLLSMTPTERGLALVQTLPVSAEAVTTLLSEYEHAQYSPYPADLARAHQASKILRSLAWKAFFTRIFERFTPRRLALPRD
jgi:transglutaminase-like putative cysteine protease